VSGGPGTIGRPIRPDLIRLVIRLEPTPYASAAGSSA
jgi:hypothetical protein